ncbi:uncharacterized protein METZ01_LOCUS508726, partial [marine metagenome]
MRSNIRSRDSGTGIASVASVGQYRRRNA